jgi:hypothetical protein
VTALPRRLGASALSVGLAGLLLAGCALLTPSGARPGADPAGTGAVDETETRSVYGFILITDVEMDAAKEAEHQQRLWDSGDASCVAPAGFEDIVAGGEVRVLGPGGVLATGSIGVGSFNSDVASANRLVGCALPFTVTGVPEGLDEYGVHVGAKNRPAYAFTASELRSGPRLILP